MRIESQKYSKEGMYLHFDNGVFIDLSKERIKQLAEEYWTDPAKIPPEIRADDDFKTCPVCPYRGQDVLCSAIKPLLPFLEVMDQFWSCDEVTAIYVDRGGVIHVSHTNLQTALQYVTNMALFEYCEDAKEYHPYFRGIMPFMNLRDASAVVLLNMYWQHGGDREKVAKLVHEITQAVFVTSRSCVHRLNLVCKNDPFVNAYAKTHLFTELLTRDMDKALKEYIEAGK